MDDQTYIRCSDSESATDGCQTLPSFGVKLADKGYISFGKIWTELTSFRDWTEIKVSLWFLDSVLGAPSSGNSISEDVVTNSDFQSQIHHGRGFALVCKFMIVAAVIGLLSIGGPAAVVFAVVTVIVTAIKGVFFRGFVSHVCHKALKSAHSIFPDLPSPANRYAPSPVPIVFFSVRVSAPGQHRGPLTISRVATCRWFWLVVRRKFENVLSGLAHVMNGLSSSAIQSLQRLIGAPYFAQEAS